MELEQINYPTPTPRPTPASTPIFELDNSIIETMVIDTFESAVTGWQMVDTQTNVLDVLIMFFIVVTVFMALYGLYRQIQNL